MKLNPLANPNVSSSKFKAKSLSFALDNRGFPHISWEEDRNGQFGILYKFWDGLKWGFYGDTPLVDRSYDGIIHSDRSLLLENNFRPMIVYGRNEEQYKVCVATAINGKWDINEINIAGDIKWIGAHIINRVEEYSTSSSSSMGESSSSSSRDSSSSSSRIDSSSSSSIYSSSSSSIDSSSSSTMSSTGARSSISSESTSSSSIDSHSTESSSSYMDSNIVIMVIDSDDVLSCYGYDGASLSLISSINIGEWNSIKTVVCGKHIGFVKNASGSLLSNFFDIFEATWASVYWTQISEATGVASFDVNGDNIEDDGLIRVAWNTDSELKMALVYSNGNQSSFYFNYAIETLDANTTSTLFSSNTKGKVAIAWDAFFQKAIIFLGGSQNTMYYVDPSSVSKMIVDIFGQPLRYAPSYLCISGADIESNVHYSFISQSDVYHFKGAVNDEPIEYLPPEITVLNSQRYKYGIFHPDENIIDFLEQPCTWDNRTGDILLETVNRTIVTPIEGEDPMCFDSSSSSSQEGETLDTSIDDNSEEFCTLEISKPNGTSFYKEFRVPYADTRCRICYSFKSYWIKDRVIITLYNASGIKLNQLDSGCIATYKDPDQYGRSEPITDGQIVNGWISECMQLKAGTSKAVVQVIAGCDENDSRNADTAWVLLTNCDCESDSSQSTDSSGSSSFGYSSDSSSFGESESSSVGYSESSSFGYSSDSSSFSESESSSFGYSSDSSSFGYSSDSSSFGESESSSFGGVSESSSWFYSESSSSLHYGSPPVDGP